MAAKNYSLKDVVVVYGPVVVGGYGETGGVSVEEDENDFEYTPNADGGGTRSANNQNSATIVLTLAQSSEANELLSALRTIDKRTGAGAQPLLIKDNNGTSLHAATSAWVEKAPTAAYEKAVGTREWTLRTDDLNSVFGKNNEVG